MFLSLPIIGLLWLIFGQEFFNCLNVAVENLAKILHKKIKYTKEKFYKPKLTSISAKSKQ